MGMDIYVSGAPCPMCMSAISWGRLDYAIGAAIAIAF
jgi:tRNA(Arg) A34 adenosine deaminase TadA